MGMAGGGPLLFAKSAFFFGSSLRVSLGHSMSVGTLFAGRSRNGYLDSLPYIVSGWEGFGELIIVAQVRSKGSEMIRRRVLCLQKTP